MSIFHLHEGDLLQILGKVSHIYGGEKRSQIADRKLSVEPDSLGLLGEARSAVGNDETPEQLDFVERLGIAKDHVKGTQCAPIG